MAITRLNSLAIPAGTVETADLSYPLTNFSSTGIDDNATSTAITIDASENVGIGTASPQDILHLYGTGSNNRLNIETTTARVESKLNSTSGTFIFGIDNSTGTGFGSAYSRNIYSNGAYPMLFWTNNAERMRITSSGNVGIGTTSPAGKLSIAGGTANNYSDGITLQKSGGNIYGIYPSTNNLEFRSITGNTHIATFDYSGNVGIGTTSPSAELDIERATGTVELQLQSRDSSDTYISFGDNDDGDVGQIKYAHSDNSMRFTTNANERMRIDSSGNVGIGTTSPNARLHVRDDVGSDSIMRIRNENTTSRTTTLQLEDYSGALADGVLKFVFPTAGTTTGSYLALLYNSAGLYIAPGGNVGIGTSGPSVGLELSGTGNTSRIKLINGSDQINFGLWDNSTYRLEGDANRKILITSYHTDGIHLGGSGTSDLVVKGGNVGIGTTSPSALLDLVGPSSTPLVLELNSANSNCDVTMQSANTSSVTRLRNGTNDFQVHTNGAERMRIDSSGNVMVGKTVANDSTVGARFSNAGFMSLVRDGGRPLFIRRDTSDGDMVEFSRNGTTVGSVSVTSSGTTYNTTSDRRLKDNIETVTDGTAKVMAMNPVTHTWKADPEADAVHGFIAQEMIGVVPEAVSVTPDGEEMMSMDYGRITPVIVAALQDAHKKIAELEARLNTLEGK